MAETTQKPENESPNNPNLIMAETTQEPENESPNNPNLIMAESTQKPENESPNNPNLIMAEITQKPENESPNNPNTEAVKKKRKYKEIAPFGNYRSYYGYRVGNDMEKDPRFKVLRKEWFEGKDCLDIGCNSGLITINVAKKFHCRSILGIDIDYERIKDAKKNLRSIAIKEKAVFDRLKVSISKVVEGSNGSTNLENTSTSSSPKRDVRDIVAFCCENIVSSQHPLPLKHYDTILCLSVTKWVHLNWGDEGLILLFAKMWKLLHPGGILILEPQPWESYYKNRLTTETTQKHYHKILFKPDDFQEILLDKIGFRTVEHATCSVSGATVGFDRPVLVFRK